METSGNYAHHSRMPLYLQVAKLMRQKIEQQEWPYGEKIPTLDNLADEFGVSRITLRAALDLLESNGIIRRTRGVGTVVMKDLSEQRWFKLPNDFDELVETVSSLKIRLLPIEHSDQALELAFPFGAIKKNYQRLRRVHYRNEVAYCLIDIYLDKTIFDLAPEDFSNSPVVPLLVNLAEKVVHGAKQIMRVTVSDKETATYLNIGVGDPIADVCRALTDLNGEVVYYAHIQYPAQMIQIETDLLKGR